MAAEALPGDTVIEGGVAAHWLRPRVVDLPVATGASLSGGGAPTWCGSAEPVHRGRGGAEDGVTLAGIKAAQGVGQARPYVGV